MTDLKPRKIVAVVFWKEETGKEPVREWLKSLTKVQKQIIGEDIKTIEMGWPLGMPLVRSLGKGIWEVRSNFRGGIARVLFKMYEDQMVLLHGFIKKSQKTPSQDLELALYTNKLKSGRFAALASASLNFSYPNLYRIGGGLEKQAEALFKSAAPAVRLAKSSTFLCIKRGKSLR